MPTRSTQSHTVSVQLQVYCAQARAASAYVEDLESERKKTESQLRDLCHDRLWAQGDLQRRRIDKTEESLKASLVRTLPALQAAREASMVACERATGYGWGVRLGRRYYVTHHGVKTDFLVQNIRPLPAGQGAARMLATGLVDNRPAMYVLGRDVLTIESVDNEKVVDITSRLHLRTAQTWL